MRRVIAMGLVAAAMGCSHQNPMAPAPVVSHTQTMPYDINIPYVSAFRTLSGANPNGVAVAPLVAQHQWDYTAAYSGMPNVYAGEATPSCGVFVPKEVVIAPKNVAALATFTSADWPNIGLEPGVTYQWLGRFTLYPVYDDVTINAAGCPVYGRKGE